MDHLQACGHCPKYDPTETSQCAAYLNMRLISLYGCPIFPYRELSGGRAYVDGEIKTGKARSGQQKQKKSDPKYHSKNDGKRKYKYEL